MVNIKGNVDIGKDFFDGLLNMTAVVSCADLRVRGVELVTMSMKSSEHFFDLGVGLR